VGTIKEAENDHLCEERIMLKREIWRELGDHLPFSILFTAAGIVLAAVLTYMATLTGAAPVVPACSACHAAHENGDADHESAAVHEHENEDAHAHAHAHASGDSDRLNAASGMLFHIFHPVHLLLSAMATTAMFFRHERRLLRAIIVGFVGSVGICGISDVFMPYLSGRLLAAHGMHFHWCLIEHPQMHSHNTHTSGIIFPYLICAQQAVP